MEKIQKDFVLDTIAAFDLYLKEKMDEREKKGYIITRNIIEEIIEELRESIK